MILSPVNCEHHQPGTVVGGGICGIDYKDKPSLGACRHCDRRKPILGWDGPADGILLVPLTARGKSISTLAVVGPKLWTELHRHALSLPGAPIEKTLRLWLDDFARRLPCGDCRSHWKKMVKATPPDLSGAAAFFAWTVARHNEVNARLGKPAMSVADALALWSAD